MIATTPSLPGPDVHAKVVAVDPIVDAVTRTVRVRALGATPGETLRPESFVDARSGAARRELAVPERGGARHRATGRPSSSCAARARSSRARCVLGRDAEGFVEVLEGLAAGDERRHLGEFPHRLRVALPRGARRRFERRRRHRRAPKRRRRRSTALTGTARHDRAHHRVQRQEPLPRPARDRRRRCSARSGVVRHIRLDAIPDLSDTQVIVYSRWDRTPDIDRGPGDLPDRHARCSARRRSRRSAASPTSATRTCTSSSRTAPTSTGRARACSSTCRKIQARLPEGVQTELGPDATGVGWVYQYALVDRTGDARRSPSCAASRTGLCATPCSAVPGVAEVAAIGGFVKQYPDHRRSEPAAAYGIPLDEVVDAVRKAATTRSAGGCSSGAAPSTWCAAAATREPSTTSRASWCASTRRPACRSWCSDVADVELGPESRRGVARPRRPGRRRRRHRRHAPRRERAEGHRPRQASARRARADACPTGVEIVTTYDRSELIERAHRHAAARAGDGDDHRQRW